MISKTEICAFISALVFSFEMQLYTNKRQPIFLSCWSSSFTSPWHSPSWIRQVQSAIILYFPIISDTSGYIFKFKEKVQNPEIVYIKLNKFKFNISYFCHNVKNKMINGLQCGQYTQSSPWYIIASICQLPNRKAIIILLANLYSVVWILQQ